jgi:hypothetical protein
MSRSIAKIKVSYMIKDENKTAEFRTRRFSNMADVAAFIAKIKTNPVIGMTRVVSTPIVEASF